MEPRTEEKSYQGQQNIYDYYKTLKAKKTNFFLLIKMLMYRVTVFKS